MAINGDVACRIGAGAVTGHILDADRFKSDTGLGIDRASGVAREGATDQAGAGGAQVDADGAADHGGGFYQPVDSCAAEAFLSCRDGGAGMVAGDAQTITDNASDWSWADSGAVDYSDEISYDADTGDVISIFRAYAEWASGTSTNTQAYATALGLANGE